MLSFQSKLGKNCGPDTIFHLPNFDRSFHFLFKKLKLIQVRGEDKYLTDEEKRTKEQIIFFDLCSCKGLTVPAKTEDWEGENNFNFHTLKLSPFLFSLFCDIYPSTKQK